jgi:hypothetical protein
MRLVMNTGDRKLAGERISGEALGDEELEAVSGGNGAGGDCGVEEGQFPRMGKCCSKSTSLSGIVYRKTCPYCSIWKSLPEGMSLAVTYIFDCSQYNYCRREKE